MVLGRLGWIEPDWAGLSRIEPDWGRGLVIWSTSCWPFFLGVSFVFFVIYCSNIFYLCIIILIIDYQHVNILKRCRLHEAFYFQWVLLHCGNVPYRITCNVNTFFCKYILSSYLKINSWLPTFKHLKRCELVVALRHL